MANKRFFLFFTFFLSFIFYLKINTISSFAIYDPRSEKNNTFGVHILFIEELNEAANLINSNNGDWGYVTIPIQSPDKNLAKWQKFMDEAKNLHIIPIIRIATKNDYFNTSVWEKPTYEEILDFANFLNSLDWPVKNRYVVIFNEVNRGDEWGGSLDPFEYADFLNFAIDTFKSKSGDFFIISAGLDNAAANKENMYMDEYSFMILMDSAIPGIFNKIDGLASHSYPNPGFSQPPHLMTPKSIHSFKYESNLAQRLGGKNLPVFVTETGWSKEAVPDTRIASYYKEAFKSVWSDNNIVAVTPFLLRADVLPFSNFSLILGSKIGPEYRSIEEMAKTKGEPKVTPRLLRQAGLLGSVPEKNFSKTQSNENDYKKLALVKATKTLFKWLLNI